MTDNSSDEDDSAHGLAASEPSNQSLRLAALQSYAILDTPRETAFDGIVRVAAYVCGTPIAVVNLIDKERQWFKAEIGLGIRETPLETSICSHAILQPGLFVVADLRDDQRFQRNPLVTTAHGLRFYAGALLQSPEGYALGTLCVLDSKPRELTTEQGELLQALAQQVMTQLELRRALRIMNRANKYRSRLMAVAGHDLKQPLQVVNLVLDGLSHRLSDDVSRARIQMAQTAIDRMVPDLDRLAVASRLEDENDLPEIETFALAEIFKAINATWAEHARHKSVRLHIAPTRIRVTTNARMLATIIGNLVGNAIKYTQRGSVLVGCRRAGAAVSIQVIDSGIGFDDERQKRLFDAFHQEDATSDGLGLGLSIVQRTAEALALPIRVRSEPGRGSVFSIEVPRAT